MTLRNLSIAWWAPTLVLLLASVPVTITISVALRRWSQEPIASCVLLAIGLLVLFGAGRHVLRNVFVGITPEGLSYRDFLGSRSIVWDEIEAASLHFVMTIPNHLVLQTRSNDRFELNLNYFQDRTAVIEEIRSHLPPSAAATLVG